MKQSFADEQMVLHFRDMSAALGCPYPGCFSHFNFMNLFMLDMSRFKYVKEIKAFAKDTWCLTRYCPEIPGSLHIKHING